MSLDKYILGFDIRITRGDWPSEYFLKSDSVTTISADPMVFPVAPDELVRRSQSEIFPKENILGLLQNFPSTSQNEANVYRIAITADEKIYKSIINRFGSALTVGELSKEDDLTSRKWTKLGYDVVDLNGLISGLLNCGPLSQELKRDFAPYINSYCLFDDYNIAEEYAKKRSIEIPAHSPFSSVAIWKQSG